MIRGWPWWAWVVWIPPIALAERVTRNMYDPINTKSDIFSFLFLWLWLAIWSTVGATAAVLGVVYFV